MPFVGPGPEQAPELPGLAGHDFDREPIGELDARATRIVAFDALHDRADRMTRTDDQKARLHMQRVLRDEARGGLPRAWKPNRHAAFITKCKALPVRDAKSLADQRRERALETLLVEARDQTYCDGRHDTLVFLRRNINASSASASPAS